MKKQLTQDVGFPDKRGKQSVWTSAAMRSVAKRMTAGLVPHTPLTFFAKKVSKETLK